MAAIAVLPGLFAISETSVFVSVAHAQQQNCYLDDRGRIVTRRRPGFTPVPCPDASPPAQPSANPGPATSPTSVEQAPDPVPDPFIEEQSSGGTVFFKEEVIGGNPASVEDSPVTAPSANPELFRLPSSGVGTPGSNTIQRDQPTNILAVKPVSPIPRPGLDDYPTPDSVAVEDNRFRTVEAVVPDYSESLLDPYNRNPLKADRPLFNDWFFSFLGISDTVVETRDLPTPVGSSSSLRPGSVGVFGEQAQSVFSQTFATELVYYKGDTVFKPPDHEFRFTPAINFNFVDLGEIQGINANPTREDDRDDGHLGIQALFYDRHLRNVSDRYDFDSIRFGIQPFSSDFRGFLFQDNQFGVRLFGNRDNNIFQYNLAWFRRLEKDTNSGLNAVGPLGDALRDDDVFIANLYWQDFPVKGFFSQGTVIYNRNREDDFHFDNNDFIQRPASLGFETPREYDVVYLGLNGDGHFDRINVTASTYLALGRESPGVFTQEDVDIAAGFAALELSMDFDWFRPRLSFMVASGDSDPLDDRATGFDAIFENPQFAGGDTTYWNRQPVPLIAGGRVSLSGRNGLLNSLRSSKEEGQSNFTNPGLILAGVGVDMDVRPDLRVSVNLNGLGFQTTEVLELARNQSDIDTNIGLDFSISTQYRPFVSQNIVLRASYARLFAGAGFDDLFPDESADYFLFNATLNY